jgi:beta-phosphoglucomutase-like phosphatase (HAD superfamily)
LSAAAIETFVIEQLRGFAADPAAWNRVLGSTLAQQRALLARKEAEARKLDQELACLRAAYRRASPAQRVRMQAPKRGAKERLAALRQQINALRSAPGSDTDRIQILVALTSAGDGPPTPEMVQIVYRLVERIDYDGVHGKLTLVMRQNEPEAATELSA